MSAKRYIIAVGSPKCPRLELPPLERVAGDVERVVGFFACPDQGYERALASELPLEATSRQIQESLAAWFAADARQETDCVVVYLAGHGDEGVRFPDHCLLTADSDLRRPDTVLRTADLVRWLFGGAGQRPQNVLLILDVCYAGQGAGESVADLAKAQGRVLCGGGAGFWAIASSDPNTEAGDGAFVTAFLEVMRDEAWLPRGGAEFLSPTELTVAVNKRFEARREAQRALFYIIAGGRVAAPFIRNPRFTTEFDGLSLADQAHWEPKARGVDSPGSPGWFFSGRRQALGELSAWLQAPGSDLRARVVTGGPGSGKSAVLGWLVLASRASTRETMIQAGQPVGEAQVPPNAIAASVHARGARLTTLSAALAAGLGCASTEPAALIAELAGRPGPIGIVVDSLDEAAEALRIEQELLGGLAACRSVRLIVGGRRRNGRAPLEGNAAVVDLDESRYFARADLVDYIFTRLTSAQSPGVYLPEAQHLHARRLAELVAERAGRSFLYARLVSRTLAQSTAAIDTTQPGWAANLSLPADLADAFGADLERFDERTRQRFVDLLVPLAYARGKGLPQKHVWHTVASGIAGREYTNADLRELKERAGYYIIQDTESGEAVFRLFHQTFADHLKTLTQDEGVERSFAKALLSLVSPAAAVGAGLWEQVDEPYLINHFSSHAAAGGLLEGQLEQPGFLLRASPESLLPELPGVRSAEGGRIARAYRLASHWIRARDEKAALGYLLWGALQHGASGLAEKLKTRSTQLPWRPEWAVWQAVVSSHVLGRAAEPISALVAGKDEQDNSIVVCGYRGGKVRMWNLATGELQLEYQPKRLRAKVLATTAYPPNATRLLLTSQEGRSLIVVAWDEGSLGVLDLAGNELGWWNSGSIHNDASALCVLFVGNETRLFTAWGDFALRSWQLPTLAPVHRRDHVTKATIYSLVEGQFQGRSVVISGGDSCHDGKYDERHLVRIWDKDLTPLWSSPECDRGLVSEVRSPVLGGVRWIAARDLGGKVSFFEPTTGVQCVVAAGYDQGLSKIIGFLPQGCDVLLLGLNYSRLRAYLLRCEAATITARRQPIETEILGDLWSDPIALGDRACLVSADARQLRVWDLQELLTAGTGADPAGGAPAFDLGGYSLSALAATESWVAAGSTAGALWLWNAEGRLCWKTRISDDEVRGLAMAQVENQPVIVAATKDGMLHKICVVDGAKLWEPIKAGQEVWALSVHVVKGKPIAFLAVNLHRVGGEGHYIGRAWNLQSGMEIETRLPVPKYVKSSSYVREWGLEPFGYYRTKTMYCLAALPQPSDTLVFLGGPHGEVRAIGMEKLKEVDRWKGGVEGDYVDSLATGICDGRPLVFGGDDGGRLFVYDLQRREAFCPRLGSAHRGHINALLLRRTAAGTCVISGGNDGVVNVWTTQLANLTRIETERRICGLAAMGEDRLAVATDRGVIVLRLDWNQIFSNAAAAIH